MKKSVVCTLFLALLLSLAGLIFAIGRTQYLYNRFHVDWIHSFVYAQKHQSFAAFDGAELCKPRDSYEDALGFLFLRGRPCSCFRARMSWKWRWTCRRTVWLRFLWDVM